MDGDWFGLAASAAGGGVFGVIGTALGRVAGFFEARQQHEFERAKWSHEVELMKLNMDVRRVEAETQIDVQNVQGSWEGLKASLEAEAAVPASYPFVNAIRALTRPALTLLLWAITAMVFFNVGEVLRERVVETAVFAATAATLWWFGDRSSPIMRHGPNQL